MARLCLYPVNTNKQLVPCFSYTIGEAIRCVFAQSICALMDGKHQSNTAPCKNYYSICNESKS